MKAKFRISLIIMLFLSLILIGTNVYAKTGTTINDTTRVRTEASTSSDTVVLLSINTEVEIVGESGDWYQVKYNSYTGYIRKDLLDVPETSEEETNTEASTVTSTDNGTVDTNAVVDESSSENETERTEANETAEENASQLENSGEITTEDTNTVEVGYKGNLTASLSMRILPSINSSIITEINANTEFTVIEIINNWCYIETDSFSGWVFLSKITTQGESETTESSETDENNEENSNESSEENATVQEETTATTTTTKYVSAETLNMRETAETTGNVIAQLSLNAEVTVVEEIDSTWSKITYNGKTGYVASQYLSDTKTTTTSRSENTTRNSTTTSDTTTSTTEDTSTESTQTSSSSTGSEVVSLAKQYLGYKYVSGGSSPSTGFDCSGFTYYIYKQFGVTLSRTSSGQASNGTAVSKSKLQPGDIVVFNNSANTSIGHVGIYIGSNTFIHAANSTKGVITTSLSDSYYSARYVTARRIFN